MTSILLAYTTVSTKEEASQLANHALEEGLVACINVFPEITSFYQWEGKVCHSEEVALLMKTTPIQKEKLSNFIKNNHPYSLPALIFMESDTTKDFLQWIKSSLK